MLLHPNQPVFFGNQSYMPSEFIEKKSPNGLNRIILSLKPLEKETVRYFDR